MILYLELILPIIGELTISSLQVCQKELYANAWHIHSTHGRRPYGHLRILLTKAAHSNCTNLAFNILPVHPTMHLYTHTANARGIQIAKAIHLFDKQIDKYYHFKHIKAELKQ